MDKKFQNDQSFSGMERVYRLIPGIRLAILLFISYALIYGVIAARNFLFPLAFATLLTYLLLPLVTFLEKKGMHRILSSLVCILLALAVLAGIAYIFYSRLSSMFDNIDAIKEQFDKNIEQFQNNLSSFLGISERAIELFISNQVDQFIAGTDGSIQRTFTATTGTLLRILLLPVFTFLFLFYRTKIAYFILKIVPPQGKFTTITILREISTVAGKYMGGVSIVVLILCVLNSTGLIIIGVQYAILLGIVSAFFNFIPYFGTLMGGAVPFLFVLLTSSNPMYYGIRVAFLFMLVQFTENYILTPNIVGGNVKISPMFVILGLIVGATVWGIPGMLVIVPFLAIVKIIFSHIPSKKPYAFLLGLKGTRKHSIGLRRANSILPWKKRKNPEE
jgi:predicted PurR-regulated permease PerM